MKAKWSDELLAVMIIIIVVLIGYATWIKVTSERQLNNFSSMVAEMERQVKMMEDQRDVLKDSVAVMENQVGLMKTKVREIDTEIVAMRGSMDTLKESLKFTTFSWSDFSLSSISGLILALILLGLFYLYKYFIKSRNNEEGSNKDINK